MTTTPDLPPSVIRTEGEGGLPVLRVSTPVADGELYLHGAHVSAWTPAAHDPVVWMSAESNFGPRDAIRGGVPVCFPWFGPGRGGDLVPAHGFARLVPWTLLSADDDGGTITLRLRLTDADVADAPGAENWRHRFEATYTVTFGEQLGLTLEVRNTGDEEFSFEEALHTYLHVQDITAVTIDGLDGVAYLDKVADERRTQSGPLTFTGQTDRVYDTTAPVTAHDPGRARDITLTKDGSASTVVWNPWDEKAAAMPDFGDAEWPGMMCIETANALQDAVTLAPGETHTMTGTYGVASTV